MVNGLKNISHITTTFGLSPYEMVFNQKPRKTIGLTQTHQKFSRTLSTSKDDKDNFHHPKI